METLWHSGTILRSCAPSTDSCPSLKARRPRLCHSSACWRSLCREPTPHLPGGWCLAPYVDKTHARKSAFRCLCVRHPCRLRRSRIAWNDGARMAISRYHFDDGGSIRHYGFLRSGRRDPCRLANRVRYLGRVKWTPRTGQPDKVYNSYRMQPIRRFRR